MTDHDEIAVAASLPTTMDERVARQMALLGLTPDMPAYVDALTRAQAGHSAWQIARALGASPEYVQMIGGPTHD